MENIKGKGIRAMQEDELWGSPLGSTQVVTQPSSGYRVERSEGEGRRPTVMSGLSFYSSLQVTCVLNIEKNPMK